MAINPSQTDTITIPELETDTLTVDSLIPFSAPSGRMKKTTALNIAGLLGQAQPPVFSDSTDFEI